MSNSKIVKRDVDFSKWYTSIITEADLIDYSLIKGTVVLKPYAWSIWKNIEKNLDKEFAKHNIENCCFPLLIPYEEFLKEKEHIEGFAPELFTVDRIGEEKLESPYVLRPTSEILFCYYFKNNVVSYNDLPIKVNQWCNVFRAEKNTRPFLRTSEFYWQEQHAVFSNKDEAIDFAYKIFDSYKYLLNNILCIPVLTGKKTEYEKFAGADFTLTLEAIMQDGQALQSGTSHYLGQNFAKSYDLKYQNSKNGYDYMEQTSAGVSTRLIGALIMTHSDDDGLILPSKIAPYQLIINTMFYEKNENVKNIVNVIENKLSNFSFKKNINDKSLGIKIQDAQIKGIPLQINIGPRDAENNKVEIFKRSTNEKIIVDIKKINDKFINDLLYEHDSIIYKRAQDNLNSKIQEVNSIEELKKAIQNAKVAFAYFDGNENDEKEIKILTSASTRCIVEQNKKGKCIKTGKLTNKKVYFARAY